MPVASRPGQPILRLRKCFDRPAPPSTAAEAFDYDPLQASYVSRALPAQPKIWFDVAIRRRVKGRNAHIDAYHFRRCGRRTGCALALEQSVPATRGMHEHSPAKGGNGTTASKAHAANAGDLDLGLGAIELQGMVAVGKFDNGALSGSEENLVPHPSCNV